MITERTLKRWRKEALQFKDAEKTNPEILNLLYIEGVNRILRMTQELLDLHLIRK